MAIHQAENLKDFLDVTKALADENRVRALFALNSGELCVCQIVELLNLAQSTVSKHMSILKNAGLVESRKRGRWVYFQLTEKRLTPLITSTFAWVFSALEKDPDMREMRKRLKKILTLDLKAICRKINQKAGMNICEA